LNNTNQVTSQGSLSYDPTSTYSWTDPTSGTAYSIPRFTVTQSLSPQQQSTLDQSNAAKYNLASLSNTESGNLNTLLGQNINLNNAPAAGNTANLSGLSQVSPVYGYDQSGQSPRFTFDDASQIGQIGSTFADTGGIQSSYASNDPLIDRQNVESAMFARLQPQTDRDLENLRSQLADQGIKYGSPAYGAAMDDFNRKLTDTRLAITAQGGQEQKLQEDILAQRAGFANAAEQQAYNEAQGRATFANSAQQQAFQQAQARGQFFNAGQAAQYQQAALGASFYNSALAQQQQQQESLFNANETARQQYLSEQYALRNQPINEVTALLSGSQVSNPNFLNTGTNKIPTTDVAGLINTNFSQNLANYQQATSQYNNVIGGLLGAIGTVGGAYLKSDRRSKKNIHKIGSVMTAAPQKLEELPVYQYEYKDDPSATPQVGPMAQDVEKIDPRAVKKDKRGTRYIDTSRVMGGILRAA
jgi:hypothetical protein